MTATGVPLVNGQAVLTLSTLAAGSHMVLFTYDTGDDNYSTNTVGATATQTVAGARLTPRRIPRGRSTSTT